MKITWKTTWKTIEKNIMKTAWKQNKTQHTKQDETTWKTWKWYEKQHENYIKTVSK